MSSPTSTFKSPIPSSYGRGENPQRLNRDIDMSGMNQVLEEIESRSAVSKANDDKAQREYSPVVSHSMASQRYEERKIES